MTTQTPFLDRLAGLPSNKRLGYVKVARALAEDPEITLAQLTKVERLDCGRDAAGQRLRSLRATAGVKVRGRGPAATRYVSDPQAFKHFRQQVSTALASRGMRKLRAPGAPPLTVGTVDPADTNSVDADTNFRFRVSEKYPGVRAAIYLMVAEDYQMNQPAVRARLTKMGLNTQGSLGRAISTYLAHARKLAGVTVRRDGRVFGLKKDNARYKLYRAAVRARLCWGAVHKAMKEIDANYRLGVTATNPGAVESAVEPEEVPLIEPDASTPGSPQVTGTEVEVEILVDRLRALCQKGVIDSVSISGIHKSISYPKPS